MTTTTENVVHESLNDRVPAYGTYNARAASRYPEGSIVCRDAAGRAYPPITADASGFPAQGVAKSYILNAVGDPASGGPIATGLDDALPVEVSFGTFGFPFTGTTPVPGDDLFVVDNHTVSTDSNGGLRGSAGKCVEVRTTQGLAKAYVLMAPWVGVGAGPGSVGRVSIPLNNFHLSTGAPMAVFADASSPTFGLTMLGGEALAIRWNNDATPGAAYCALTLPTDLDESRDITLEFDCAKSGATVGDATTLTVAAFLTAVGDLYDADADAGGVTGALVGNAAAKTTALLSRAIAAADVPSGARVLNFNVKPTAGTLGTDDFFLLEARLRYTRR